MFWPSLYAVAVFALIILMIFFDEFFSSLHLNCMICNKQKNDSKKRKYHFRMSLVFFLFSINIFQTCLYQTRKNVEKTKTKSLL
jgi:hypothetical protein